MVRTDGVTGACVLRRLALLGVLLCNPLHAKAVAQAMLPPPMGAALPMHDAPLELRTARPLSPQEEAALRPRDLFRECTDCTEMVVVSEGKFIMGASLDENGSTNDERPQHLVSVPRFAAGRLPVSLSQWTACVSVGACSAVVHAVNDRPSDPASGILWEEAREFVQWLSLRTGRPYRLLSEAEREYVTRAGTTTAFWWGDGPNAPSVQADATPATEIDSMPQSAKSHLDNPFGLRDVHGDVYDWVEDCWHENYRGAPNDGSAWIEPDCKAHVLRGGSAGRALRTRRSAARLWSGPPNRLDYMGLRVARSLAR